MKRITIILCLLLAVCIKASAQDALYVIDGKVSNANIKPSEVLITSILDSTEAIKQYGRNFKNGVTVIITRAYAVQQIQQKIGTLNKKYKDYLDKKHDDSNLAYVLNNNILNMSRKNAVNELYELSPDDIKSVTFKKDAHFSTDATVVITTKE